MDAIEVESVSGGCLAHEFCIDFPRKKLRVLARSSREPLAWQKDKFEIQFL